MTPTGTFTQFPLPHRDSSSSPYWITDGPDGNLWFTEFAGSQIGCISPAGVITEFPLPAAVDEPLGIAAGPDGNLWFTQVLSVEKKGMSDAIGRITPTGVITEFPLPSSGSSSARGAAGPEGTHWLTRPGGETGGQITSGS